VKIVDYQEREPAVIRIDGDWLSAFVGDDIPRIGEALELRSDAGQLAYAAVRRHTGGREVDAMLLGRPDWARKGTPVAATGQDARLQKPAPGSTRLDSLSLSANQSANSLVFRPRRPAFAELIGARPVLKTGFAALDSLAPLARNGVNLVLDATADLGVFNGLCRRAAEAGSYDAILWQGSDEHASPWATHRLLLNPEDSRPLSGMRVLASWAGWLRDEGAHLLVCAELPVLNSPGFATPVQTAQGISIGEVIDLVGSTLNSTEAASITTMLRLPLFASAVGLESIIETMDLGEIDAQIFVDSKGRFDPYRSNSDADLDAAQSSERHRLLSILSHAARARDKYALMGEFGATQAELDALEQAEALRGRLSD
jgi:hypothetical protein